MEAATTVNDAGVDPLMASATARRQAWADNCRAALDTEGLGGLLDAILAARTNWTAHA